MVKTIREAMQVVIEMAIEKGFRHPAVSFHVVSDDEERIAIAVTDGKDRKLSANVLVKDGDDAFNSVAFGKLFDILTTNLPTEAEPGPDTQTPSFLARKIAARVKLKELQGK